MSRTHIFVPFSKYFSSYQPTEEINEQVTNCGNVQDMQTKEILARVLKWCNNKNAVSLAFFFVIL